MSVHGRASLLAAGCFTLLIGGCGGSGPVSPAATSAPIASGAPATATSSDACSYVTKSDAESALGEPVGPSKPRSTATSSGCAYTSLSGSARLDVDITRWPDSATAANKYQEFANIGQPVAGLGDQARGNTGILVVQKGSNLLQISMPVADKQPDPFGAMKALAVKVLAHF
jgi:Protein of unknown function (DUF3558)